MSSHGISADAKPMARHFVQIQGGQSLNPNVFGKSQPFHNGQALDVVGYVLFVNPNCFGDVYTRVSKR